MVFVGGIVALMWEIPSCQFNARICLISGFALMISLIIALGHLAIILRLEHAV